jgi:signal transduction histidine kinase
LKKQQLSLKTLMNQVLTLFTPRFQAKNIQVTLRFEPPELNIYADLDKLLQALRNLLENAWRYTPQGGQLEIFAQQTAGGVKLAISNTGPGISSADLPFIFERFFRADRSRSRKKGGAGIGLAIVKELIEAHGGQVGAESANGKTCIWLQFPISP